MGISGWIILNDGRFCPRRREHANGSKSGKKHVRLSRHGGGVRGDSLWGCKLTKTRKKPWANITVPLKSG